MNKFNKWFRNSKAVDAIGNPLVVYHGTAAFDPLDPHGFSKFNTIQDELGSHFGNLAVANSFARSKRRFNRIIPVYLSIKKPLYLTDVGSFQLTEIGHQLIDLGIISLKQANLIHRDSNKHLQPYIERAGCDGVFYLNRREGLSPKILRKMKRMRPQTMDALTDAQFKQLAPEASISYIEFKPTQIKSAVGNNGCFDSLNPNFCS